MCSNSLPPAIPVTMEAIPDGPVPLPSIFDWLLILCFSSAFSDSSWSMSACRASIVSSNSLQRRGGGGGGGGGRRTWHSCWLLLQNMTLPSESTVGSHFSFFFSRVWASSSRVWIFSTRSSASLEELSSFFSSRLRRTFASLSSSPWKHEHNDSAVLCFYSWWICREKGVCSPTLILRDFFSSLMTVSLSSSFMPRPSASVISARRAADRTSTGGGFWGVTTEWPQNSNFWTSNPSVRSKNHSWEKSRQSESPCSEASLSHTLPPAWRWPSCSWLLWRCCMTAADTRRGWRPGIHRSENDSEIFYNQSSSQTSVCAISITDILKYHFVYLLSCLERHVLQFDGRQPLLFTERRHHLSSGRCNLLQHGHHPGEVFPAVWEGVWHLQDKRQQD